MKCLTAVVEADPGILARVCVISEQLLPFNRHCVWINSKFLTRWKYQVLANKKMVLRLLMFHIFVQFLEWCSVLFDQFIAHNERFLVAIQQNWLQVALAPWVRDIVWHYLYVVPAVVKKPPLPGIGDRTFMQVISPQFCKMDCFYCIYSFSNKAIWLFQTDMQGGVHARFLDQSTSVREAAVELVGKFILVRSELTAQYFDMLSERILVSLLHQPVIYNIYVCVKEVTCKLGVAWDFYIWCTNLYIWWRNRKTFSKQVNIGFFKWTQEQLQKKVFCCRGNCILCNLEAINLCPCIGDK